MKFLNRFNQQFLCTIWGIFCFSDRKDFYLHKIQKKIWNQRDAFSNDRLTHHFSQITAKNGDCSTCSDQEIGVVVLVRRWTKNLEECLNYQETERYSLLSLINEMTPLEFKCLLHGSYLIQKILWWGDSERKKAKYVACCHNSWNICRSWWKFEDQ